MGRFFTSILLLFFVTATFAQNARQHFKAGEQFLANGMTEAAIEEFNKAVSLSPDDGELYALRAQALYKNGDSLKAAIDFEKAAALGKDAEKNYFSSANTYYQIKKNEQALTTLNNGLLVKPKNFNLLLLKTRISFEQEDYKICYETSKLAIEEKDMALAYYYLGASARRIGLYDEADKFLEKAIIRNGKMVQAYLELAENHYDRKNYDYCIDNCSMVLLLLDPKNVDALILRSKAFKEQNDLEPCLTDISRAINLQKENASLYRLRGNYYLDYAQYNNAINDYTIALNLSPDSTIQTLKNRAHAYELINKTHLANNDYQTLLSIIKDDAPYSSLKKQVEERIFELGRETEKPTIIVHNQLNEKNELTFREGTERIKISGEIQEKTQLRELKLNNNKINYIVTDNNNYQFEIDIAASDVGFITLTATDVYDNTATLSYPIRWVEKDKPQIVLLSPVSGHDGHISVEKGDNVLYIEGKIEDRSIISEIKIDEVNASYVPGEYNPRFTATINTSNRKNITISATDEYGNTATQTFNFTSDGQVLAHNNPMGKTWVIIIENSEYDQYTNLSGPAGDVIMLKTALDRYNISKILHKQNLSKRELERFFSIDLRDLIVSNKVNSLLIWYAGHGTNLNGNGYWIPADGRLNDEYSYYNINALKASLYSYKSLTHILMVSDACQAGESFAIAMRGTNNMLNCSNTNLTQHKSALAFTSSSDESALDNSLFTRTFVNALANNPADCIPIDAIVDRVNIVVKKNTFQEPVFGRITGLEDENGTFFFITK